MGEKEKPRKAGRKPKPKRGTPKTDTLNKKFHSGQRARERNRIKRERRKSREAGDDDTVEHCDEGELTEEEAGEGVYFHHHHHHATRPLLGRGKRQLSDGTISNLGLF